MHYGSGPGRLFEHTGLRSAVLGRLVEAADRPIGDADQRTDAAAALASGALEPGVSASPGEIVARAMKGKPGQEIPRAPFDDPAGQLAELIRTAPPRTYGHGPQDPELIVDPYQAAALVALAPRLPGDTLESAGLHTSSSRLPVEGRLPSFDGATDNDYAVWTAFANHYWPALYFADAQGHIRHHNFGEGEYQQSEMVIQQLLAEAGTTGHGHAMVTVDARGAEAPADWASLRSPENYTGYARTRELRVARRDGAGQASRL